MYRPTFQVLLDTANDGSFATNIKDDVLGFDYTRGRDYASAAKGKSVAGSANILVKNFTGKYSLFDKRSSLYGLLDMRIRVRILIGITSSIEAQLTGRLDDCILSSEESGHATSTLKVTGIIKDIQGKKFNVALAENLQVGDAIKLILDSIGMPVDTSNDQIDLGSITFPFFIQEADKEALNAIREIEYAERGFFYEAKDGEPAFEGRYHRASMSNDTRHLYPKYVFSDGDSNRQSSFRLLKPRQGNRTDSIINSAKAITRDLYQGTPGTLIYSIENAPDASLFMPYNVAVEYWLDIPTMLNNVDVAAIKDWETIHATFDYLGNTRADGLGVDLTTGLTVTVTCFSKAVKIRLLNQHVSASDGYLSFLKLYGTPIYERPSISYKNSTSASVTKYGEMSGSDAILIPTLSEAKKWVTAILNQYSYPLPPIVFEVIANESEETQLLASELDLGDMIHVIAKNKSRIGVAGDFYVEKISRNIRNGGETDVLTLECSKVQNRTWNEILYSEEFDRSATWVPHSAATDVLSDSSVAEVDPDGGFIAEKIIEATTGSDLHSLSQEITVVAAASEAFGNPLVVGAFVTDGAANIFSVNLQEPLPNGTLVSFSTYTQVGSGVNTFYAYVLRPTGLPNQYSVVYNSGALVVPSVGSNQVTTFPVTPFVVQDGDLIAHYGKGIPYSGSGSDTTFYPADTPPVVDQIIEVDGTDPLFPLFSSDRIFSLQANVYRPVNYFVASGFVKAGERDYVRLELDAGSQKFAAVFDLLDGKVATLWTGTQAMIQHYGDDWYRISISGVLTVSGTHNLRIILQNGPGVVDDENANAVYAGIVGDGLYVWGFQYQTGLTIPMEYVKSEATAIVNPVGWTLDYGILDISTNLREV